MTIAERLSQRRSIVAAARDVTIDKWLAPNHGVGTCPRGHAGMWALLDDPIQLFCPGGRERDCWSELQEIVRDIRQEVASNEFGMLPLASPTRKTTNGPSIFKADICPLQVWRDAMRRKGTLEDLFSSSPFRLKLEEPWQQWRLLLQHAFGPTDLIWVGRLWETSKPEFFDRFRSTSDWLKLPEDHYNEALGSHWCCGSFRWTGTRSAKYIDRQKIFSFEGDKTPLQQQAHLLVHLIECGWPIASVTYSGGKSLHATFCTSVTGGRFQSIKLLLKGLNFDISQFKRGGTSRLPGWSRHETRQWQRLVYLNPEVFRCKRNHQPDLTPKPLHLTVEGFEDFREWKKTQEADGRVFGFDRDERGRISGYYQAENPELLAKTIQAEQQLRLERQQLETTMRHLLILVPTDLIGIPIDLHLNEAADRLAKILNDAGISRCVDGIKNYEDRRELDITGHRWLAEDVEAIVQAILQQDNQFSAGRYALRRADNSKAIIFSCDKT